MANYCCAIRTNYFHVKDAEAFRALMSRVYGESDVSLWEQKDEDGNPVFAFGTYGGISGLTDSNGDVDDDAPYDDFIDCLQKSVADDDAIIILESGNEKLRYVIGTATVITSSGYEFMDITTLAAEQAAEMLHNSAWRTRCFS